MTYGTVGRTYLRVQYEGKRNRVSKRRLGLASARHDERRDAGNVGNSLELHCNFTLPGTVPPTFRPVKPPVHDFVRLFSKTGIIRTRKAFLPGTLVVRESLQMVPEGGLSVRATFLFLVF